MQEEAEGRMLVGGLLSSPLLSSLVLPPCALSAGLWSARGQTLPAHRSWGAPGCWLCCGGVAGPACPRGRKPFPALALPWPCIPGKKRAGVSPTSPLPGPILGGLSEALRAQPAALPPSHFSLKTPGGLEEGERENSDWFRFLGLLLFNPESPPLGFNFTPL